MRETVVALIVKDGKIFMGKRSEDRKHYAGRFHFPGGHVREGESLLDTLKREMKEELGIDVRAGLQCSSIMDIDPTSGRGFRHHIFIVKDWAGELKGSKEAVETGWFSKDEIKDIDTFPVTFLMLKCLKKIY